MDRCWVYDGYIDHQGYGAYGQGRTRLVHRIAYEILVGPIPPDLELDHLCRNRACYNPAHLEPVTHAENMRRSPIGNQHRGKDACVHGHPFTEDNIRWWQKPNGSWVRYCKQCNRRETAKHYQRKKAVTHG